MVTAPLGTFFLPPACREQEKPVLSNRPGSLGVLGGEILRLTTREHQRFEMTLVISTDYELLRILALRPKFGLLSQDWTTQANPLYRRFQVRKEP